MTSARSRPRPSVFTEASTMVALAVLLAAGCAGPASGPAGADERAPANLQELLGPWQPVALSMDDTIAEALRRRCRGLLDQMSETVLGGTPLIEARGGGTATVFFATDGAIGSCETIRIEATGEIAPQGATYGVARLRPPSARVEPGDVRHVASSIETVHQAPWTWVVGKAGSDVVEVHVSVAGQPEAIATRQGEWFAASWPRPAEMPIVIVGLGADGRELDRVSYTDQ